MTRGYVSELEAMEVGERSYYPTTADECKTLQKRLIRSPSQLPSHMKRRGFSCVVVIGYAARDDEPHYLVCVERTA